MSSKRSNVNSISCGILLLLGLFNNFFLICPTREREIVSPVPKNFLEPKKVQKEFEEEKSSGEFPGASGGKLMLEGGKIVVNMFKIS